jgi:hypothetical protein
MSASGFLHSYVSNIARPIMTRIREMYGESVWDEESVPFINLGYEHGRYDRGNR